MAPTTCGNCGASVDVYMTTCAACRRPLTPGGDEQSAPTWGQGEADSAQLALLSPVETRSGEPAPTALAWVIALLPVFLMIGAIAAGWWPNPVVLVAQIVLVLAVIGWDSRRLDRELIDVSWLWGLLTPATYLFIRAIKCGRGHVAAWLGLISTSAWIVGVLVGAFLAVMTSAPVVSYRLNQELREVSSATTAFRNAQVEWTQAPGNSGAAELQDAARNLSVALDGLRAELTDDSTPDDLELEVTALSASLDELSDEIDDVASADGLLEVSRQQCEASIASHTNDKAIAVYLSATGSPEAATIAALLPASKASADYCVLNLPLIDAVESFVDSVKTGKSLAALRTAYGSFAGDIEVATSGMRDQTWPEPLRDEMVEVISEYERAASAASQVAAAFDARDFPAAREAGREMAEALKSAGAAEVSLSLAWNSYAEEFSN